MPNDGTQVQFTPLPGTQGSIPEGAFEQAGADDPRKLLAGAAQALKGSALPPESVKDEDNASEEPEEDVLKVDIVDKKAYLRSMLAGERFTKTYELFGGADTVTFASRMVAENEHISLVIEKASFSYPGEKDLWSQRVRYLHARYGETAKCDTLEGYRQVFTEKCGILSDTVYAAEFKSFMDFESICDKIYARANEPDFWKGTAGAS